MVSLQDRIKNSLDEARMLMLGAQVLLGFQYSGVFQSAFERLALGITGDFYVVVKKVCHSSGLALGLSVLLLLFFFGLWFGLTLYHRLHHERPAALLRPHRAA